MKHAGFCLCIAVLLLGCTVVPVGAVLQEVTVKGTVTAVNPAANTLAVGNPFQYGCDYPATGAPVCTYTAMNASVLSGTVPDAAAFGIFNVGDPVVATSIGGAGGTWISLAKLYSSQPGTAFVTDIAGDINAVQTPLIGNYALDTMTVPNCSACTGTTCVATAADMGVKSEGKVVFTKELKPGESFTYNARNDGSSVAVTFVHGEALSTTCPGKAGMTGPQAISVYVVHVVPPIGSAVPSQLTMVSTTTPTTTGVPATMKAGVLPFTVVGALGLVGLVLVRKRG